MAWLLHLPEHAGLESHKENWKMPEAPSLHSWSRLNLTKRIESGVGYAANPVPVLGISQRELKAPAKYTIFIETVVESHKENWKMLIWYTNIECSARISQRELKDIRASLHVYANPTGISQRELKVNISFIWAHPGHPWISQRELKVLSFDSSSSSAFVNLTKRIESDYIV